VCVVFVCERACMRACVCACVRACMSACLRLVWCVCVCVYVLVCATETTRQSRRHQCGMYSSRPPSPAASSLRWMCPRAWILGARPKFIGCLLLPQVCLSVCLSVYLSVCLSVCLSVFHKCVRGHGFWGHGPCSLNSYFYRCVCICVCACVCVCVCVWMCLGACIY